MLSMPVRQECFNKNRHGSMPRAVKSVFTLQASFKGVFTNGLPVHGYDLSWVRAHDCDKDGQCRRATRDIRGCRAKPGFLC